MTKRGGRLQRAGDDQPVDEAHVVADEQRRPLERDVLAADDAQAVEQCARIQATKRKRNSGMSW